MNSYRQDLPPIPKRLLSLPIERGYPVPWFVAKVGDNYDFRCIDHRKLAPAVKNKLCWICGQKLGTYLAFGIGPMCCINRTIAEPPSHKDCMEWTMKVCPFLIGRQEERRETNLPKGVREQPGFAIKRNPGVVCLWITKSYHPFNAPGGILFKIGEPLEIHWFKEGRAATRAECIESIESGYPKLLELAKVDGDFGVQELEKKKLQAMKLLPATSRELIALCRQKGVSMSEFLGVPRLKREDAIVAYRNGDITEGQLADYLGVDRLEARRIVQEESEG